MIVGSRLLKTMLVATAVAFLALAWATERPPSAEAVFDDSDGDFAIDLIEFVTGSDPNDPRSTSEDTGAQFVSGAPLCSDNFDNDQDGLTDEDDDGCLDNDGDIISNAMETLLGSDPNSSGSTPEDSRLDAVFEFIGFGIVTCADGSDNDGDGAIDGDDPGCAAIRNDADDFDDFIEKLFGSDPADANSVPEHETPNPGSCSDGRDNDLDGLTDSADIACAPIENDDFADATVITALPFTDSLKITSATSERSEPRSSCFFGGSPATVWYSYTPSADGVLVADSTRSNFESVLAVWHRDGSRLAEVGCITGYGGRGLLSSIAFRVSAGETYFFQVGGFIYEGSAGDLTFHLETGTPPANDEFGSPAIISSLPFSDEVDMTAATSEFGEPPPPCAYDRVMSSVWYRFAPSTDTLVVLDTTGSDFNPPVGVYTQTIFGLSSVACSYGFPPRLAFEAQAGQTYFIQVATVRYSGPPGNLSLSVEVGIPPANDGFAGATNVPSVPFSDSFDPLTATTEVAEPRPTCAYDQVANTVWYRHTAAADGYLVASAAGTDFYGASIGVYTGASLDDLSQVACSTPYYPEDRLAFAVEAGQTYYVQLGRLFCCSGQHVPLPVSGEGSGERPEPGELLFTLDTLDVPPCAPAEFTVDDPAGDSLGFFGPPLPEDDEQRPIDILSVSGGADRESFCLRVQFADPLPTDPTGREGYAFTQIDFDTDENPDTGYESSLEYQCPGGPDLGVELGVYFNIPSNILITLYPYFSEPGPVPPPTGPLNGYVLFDERSYRLIIPLEALGGDDAFRFGVSTTNGFGFDCAPNGGGIRSPEPAALGDANCDGQVNAIDSTIILQRFAGLLTESLPCQYAADVNGNGDVGPIDAVLILQYESGMLPALPAR